MWTTMHQVTVKETLSYWVPVLLIMLSIVCILVRSFYRYHMKKVRNRLLQHDYLEVNFNIHRRRIGDIHCFSHSSRISDLTMSLSSNDLRGWIRTPRGKLKYSRSISNPGSDRYGNPLGTVPEENLHERQRTEFPAHKSEKQQTYNTGSNGYTSGRRQNILNSYYEEAGLPVPSKYNSRRKTEKKEKKKQHRIGLDSMYRNDNDYSNENNVLELTNRRSSGITRSPRRLPELESSYWRLIDPSLVAQMGSLPIDPEESRSLSHQYEYELTQQQQFHLKKKRKLREKIERIVQQTNEKQKYVNTNRHKRKEKEVDGDRMGPSFLEEENGKTNISFQSSQDTIDGRTDTPFPNAQNNESENSVDIERNQLHDKKSRDKRTFLLDPSDIPQSTV